MEGPCQGWIYGVHGRIARQGRAGLRGRGAGAPGDACRLRPPSLAGRVDLPEVPFARPLRSPNDLSAGIADMDWLAYAGAAHKRRATVVASVLRTHGGEWTYRKSHSGG